MNKKFFILAFLIIAIVSVIIIILIKINNENIKNKDNTSNIEATNKENIDKENSNIEKDKIEENKEKNMDEVYIKINNQVFNVELEESVAAKELKEKLKSGDIIVNAREYGGFEKVGNLGFSLTREDKNIDTTFGDIVLYQGNQISLFYNSNSWSYTKIGKIKDITQNDLKNILGNGDITLIFTLSK